MNVSPQAGQPPQLPSKPRDLFRQVGWLGFVALFGWSWYSIDFGRRGRPDRIKWTRLLDAPGDMWRLAKAMFRDLPFDRLGHLAGQMWDSIAMAWMGTLIGALFAVPLAFLAAENLVAKPVAWATRQLFNLIRAVPEIIIALLFVPMFGLKPMAGVIAIGIHSIGSLGKLLFEIIEGIDPGPVEAADAAGANAAQRLRWAVIPQVAPELTSFVLYRFEINIRAAAVLGMVGAGGIGNDLAQAIRFKEYGIAGLALIVIVVGTIAVDMISGAVRRRIIAGPGGRRGTIPSPEFVDVTA